MCLSETPSRASKNAPEPDCDLQGWQDQRATSQLPLSISLLLTLPHGFYLDSSHTVTSLLPQGLCTCYSPSACCAPPCLVFITTCNYCAHLLTHACMHSFIHFWLSSLLGCKLQEARVPVSVICCHTPSTWPGASHIENSKTC